MKKIMYAMAIVFLFFVGMVSAVTTSAATTVVYGTVTNSDTTPAVNARVVTYCYHNNVATVQTKFTDTKGQYSIDYYSGKCAPGDRVDVIASSITRFSAKSGYIVYKPVCQLNMVKVNLKLVN